MKALNYILAFLLIVSMGGVIYLLVRKPQLPDGYVQVPSVVWDSIKNVQSKPPIIITKDSVIYRDSVVYRTKPVPYPVYVDNATLSFYSDSLINDSAWFVVNDIIKGELIDRTLKHRAVYREKIVTITEQVPVYVESVVEGPLSRVFVGINALGNDKGFIGGAELGLINKKGTMYSIHFMHDTKRPYIGASFKHSFRISKR